MTINTNMNLEAQQGVLKRWLNPSELEVEYGFSKSSQAKMRMASNSSTLPFTKIGRYIRYDRHAIDTWLENHMVQGVA